MGWVNIFDTRRAFSSVLIIGLLAGIRSLPALCARQYKADQSSSTLPLPVDDRFLVSARSQRLKATGNSGSVAVKMPAATITETGIRNVYVSISIGLFISHNTGVQTTPPLQFSKCRLHRCRSLK